MSVCNVTNKNDPIKNEYTTKSDSFSTTATTSDSQASTNTATHTDSIVTNNDEKKDFFIRDGKMIGIKIKRSEDIMVIPGKINNDVQTVVFHYLPVCKQLRKLKDEQCWDKKTQYNTSTSTTPLQNRDRDNDRYMLRANSKTKLKKSHKLSMTQIPLSKPWLHPKSTTTTKRKRTIAKKQTNSLSPNKKKQDKIRYRISSSVWEYNCIKNALLKAGFYRTTNQYNWNVLWGKHLTVSQLAKLHPFQRANHFPGTSVLGRKDLLAHCMNNMKNIFGKRVYNFIPQSYVLPQQWFEFFQHCKHLKQQSSHVQSQSQSQQYGSLKKDNVSNININNIWLTKPFASSCGRGIKLITDCYQIEKHCHVVAQEYLKNPYLIDGRKFDLRLYVLVTSFDPLIIYLFDDGLVRFSTKKFSLSPRMVRNKQIHLTNYSVQKKYGQYSYNHDNANGNNNSQNNSTPSSISQTQQQPQTQTQVPGPPFKSYTRKTYKKYSKRSSKHKKHRKKSNKRQETDMDQEYLDQLYSQTKWSLQQLWHFLETYDKKNIGNILDDIHDLIIKSLIAAHPYVNQKIKQINQHKLKPYRKATYIDQFAWNQCFEIYGFDVILDEKLKPWLLEVNLLPSLSSSSPLDKRIKTTLVCDVFHCIGVQPIDLEKLKNSLRNKNKPYSPLRTSRTTISEDTEISEETSDNETTTTEEETDITEITDLPDNIMMQSGSSGSSSSGSTNLSEASAPVGSNINSTPIKNVTNIAKTMQDMKNCKYFEITYKEQTLLSDICDQFSRKSHLNLIFPVRRNIQKYCKLFEKFEKNINNHTYNNQLLWAFLSSSKQERDKILSLNKTISDINKPSKVLYRLPVNSLYFPKFHVNHTYATLQKNNQTSTKYGSKKRRSSKSRTISSVPRTKNLMLQSVTPTQRESEYRKPLIYSRTNIATNFTPNRMVHGNPFKSNQLFDNSQFKSSLMPPVPKLNQSSSATVRSANRSKTSSSSGFVNENMQEQLSFKKTKKKKRYNKQHATNLHALQQRQFAFDSQKYNH